ncbi:hypothetical protein HIM_01994 [Hirsutella minnesotensis 3608]|nr:hypothetical protein HIM_01994 [Hirsutella minnesotensis 3608]
MTSKAPPLPPLNSWESRALDYQFDRPSGHYTRPSNQEPEDVVSEGAWRQLQDPLIFPGLYSATGVDMMGILLRVISRPNPQIELGAIDCSVSLVLCDLELPDAPIVYVSDSFCQLTGYSKPEVLGRNCRFLQSPPTGYASPINSGTGSGADKAVIRRIRQAINSRREVQLEVTNYKKNGVRFTNALSIVPIAMNSSGYHYAVGFQVEI